MPKPRKLATALASVFLLTLCACTPQQDSITSSEGMIIEPRVGLGSIKIGMPMDAVVDEFGPPRVKIGPTLGYPDLGFTVLPGEPNIVGAIMMGDSSGGSLVDAFKGKTQNGIGMGSTEQEILSIFGSPDPLTGPKAIAREEARQGLKTLRYQRLRLTLVLRERSLAHITLK